MKYILRLCLLTVFVFSAWLAPGAGAAPRLAIKAEGVDFSLGGEGAGQGKFFSISDIAFDRAGNLYVLDGLVFDKGAKAWLGNNLVQKFDANGKWLSQFSVANPANGDTDAPERMAIDGEGRIYISKPQASKLEQYSAQGTLMESLEIPGVVGVALWKRDGVERIVAIGGTEPVVNRKRVTRGGDEILVLSADGSAVESQIKLERALKNVGPLAADSAGNFYVLADFKQLYKFGPTGALLQTIGAGDTGKTRFRDGSQLTDALALDSKGNVAAASWSDVALFDAAFETVAQRPGRFNIANNWNRMRFAFAPNDRLWVASTVRNDVRSDRKGKYFSDKPAVLRLAENFLEPKQPGVERRSTLLMGFAPEITTTVPYHVAHEAGPFPLEIALPAAQRPLSEIEVRWRLLDTFGAQNGQGDFKMSLKDGEAVRQSFAVSPTRYGWYAVVADYVSNGKVLRTQAKFIGVTPRYAGMDAPAGNDPKVIGPKGGWEDPARQVFSGLPFLRLHAGKDLDKLEKAIANANAAGANTIVQLTGEEDVQPDRVRELVTRFKGRIAIYELINEPNISLRGGLNRYIEIWKTTAPIVREIDPAAKLMGPATVNIDLPFIDKFFAACAPLVDIVSTHDYEGHNTFDATHWHWKFGELRKLMAKHGLENKPLWQTERAMGAVTRGNFAGLNQAVELSYHYDLLQTLGIPPEHNSHYYLNEGGYASVPTYVWSLSGPHPAALAMRTRQALTGGREYQGTVDFGPTGNKLFLGLRYGPRDGDGGLVLVRNLGLNDVPLALQGTGAWEMHDAFGNTVEPGANKTVTIGQMPLYIRLTAGASITFPKWDWGRNFAAEAKFTYSAPSSNPAAPPAGSNPAPPEPGAGVIEAAPEDAVKNLGNIRPDLLTEDPGKLLVNGILETHHWGSPFGGASKSPRFLGEIPSFPQTLDITFPTARPISRLAVFSEQADNGFCALLDYDVQGWQGGAWKTMAEVRTPIPVSTPAESFATSALTWQADTNRSFVQFAAPVTTDKLRLVIRRTTFGFAPDEGVRNWSTILKPMLMLKEIEVY